MKKVVIAILILAVCGGAGIYFSGIDLSSILPAQISENNEAIVSGGGIESADIDELTSGPAIDEPLTKPIEEIIDDDDEDDTIVTQPAIAEKPQEKPKDEKPVVDKTPAKEPETQTTQQPAKEPEKKPVQTPEKQPEVNVTKPAVEVTPVATKPAVEQPPKENEKVETTAPAIETPVASAPSIEEPKNDIPVEPPKEEKPAEPSKEPEVTQPETPAPEAPKEETPKPQETITETPKPQEPAPEVPNEPDEEITTPADPVVVPEVTLADPQDPKTLARIKYITSKYKTISYDDAAYYVALFEKFAGEREYLDVEVLMGIARIESGFNPTLTGKYMGMMQVSSYYGQAAGYSETQLQTAYYNLEYACSILDDLNRRFAGELPYIVLGYNQGYFGLKAKIDSGAEINYYFYNTCIKYADQIRALYE